jgi:hypothetical protein
MKNDSITNREFRKGDILHSTMSDKMVIFKKYGGRFKNAFCIYVSNLPTRDNYNWDISWFRHATEEEKQYFLKYLNSRGLHWDAEKKELENLEPYTNLR